MSLRLRRGVAVFAVVLLLGALPVLASEGPGLRGGWLAKVGAWVDQMLGSVGLRPVFEKSACGIDPNGRPIPCPGPEMQGDCGIDPNGRPRPCSDF